VAIEVAIEEAIEEPVAIVGMQEVIRALDQQLKLEVVIQVAGRSLKEDFDCLMLRYFIKEVELLPRLKQIDF
jgi:hypothetical protein